MPVFFCTQTGVRIAAPGVSKAVDPVNGQDEVLEQPDGSLQVVGAGVDAKAHKATKHHSAHAESKEK